MSNQCPYCGSLRNVCVSPVSFNYVCLACEKFFSKGEQPKQTVFDRITASLEVLARTYMFNYDGKVFKSLLLPNMVFNSREEALAATVARLKEAAEENG